MEKQQTIAQISPAAQAIEELKCDGLIPQRLTFANGEVVHDHDQPANRYFLIETGGVRLYHVQGGSHSRLLDILGPNDWIGAAALAQLPVYGKRAIAIGPSLIWVFEARPFLELLARRGDLAVQILQNTSKKLIEAWNQSTALATDDCRNRLIQTLLRFSGSSAAEPSEDGVMLRITHAQLAQAVGAARETVSICLTELRNKKIVRTGRNQLSFHPDRLREMEKA